LQINGRSMKVKVSNLSSGSTKYTCNVYLVTGTWNAIDDVNTLVDVGRDSAVIEKIGESSTGVGKKRVAQVVLTHNHYDHTALLPVIRETFNPRVYAFSPLLEGVDRVLKDGDTLRMGDRLFEVLHVPGHSNDSICLYSGEERVVFVGDTAVINLTADASYGDDFLRALERLCRKNVETIYFGHGRPLASGVKARLRDSLNNVRKAKIVQ